VRSPWLLSLAIGSLLFTLHLLIDSLLSSSSLTIRLIYMPLIRFAFSPPYSRNAQRDQVYPTALLCLSWLVEYGRPKRPTPVFSTGYY